MADRHASGSRSRELARCCERALVRAARTAEVGSRQQIRAAARRFLRAHCGDHSYLEWVLRAVGASAALAVALLGLGAEPASAKATWFDPLQGIPISGPSAGGSTRVAPADLDGDGDADLLGGASDGTLLYWENTGSATLAAFATRTGSANPLAGQDVGANATPAFGDLDRDGDLDLVAGSGIGGFAYFENTGSATLPAFVARTGSANPLDGQDASTDSSPALGDLDGDADLDLVVGTAAGAFSYYENTGSALLPSFVLRTGSASPVAGFPFVGGPTLPALGDLDRDGDLDLVASSGTFPVTFVYFDNTGTAASPAFVQRLREANPTANTEFFTPVCAALGDLDGDGDLDLFVRATASGVGFVENQAGGLRANIAVGFFGNFDDIFGRLSAGDLDGDGDLDLVGNNGAGGFRYHENTGVADGPEFALRTGSANPLDGFDLGTYSRPTLGDLDADGDLDLFSGTSAGGFAYLENTGSASTPAFVERTGSANPLDGEDIGGSSSPVLADLDRDGDLDLAAGAAYESPSYYENTGAPSAPAFVRRTGSANPLQSAGYANSFALGDLDSDGDLDLVGDEGYPTFSFFENTGIATLAAFAQRTGSANPAGAIPAYPTLCLADLDGDGDTDLLADEVPAVLYENAVLRPTPRYFGPLPPPFENADVGTFSAPAAGDLDADGDPDFVVADRASGALSFFENTGTRLLPAVMLQTGAANPFDGLDAGAAPALSLGDVDADGDLDLVSGDAASVPLHFFENTGSAAAPAFVEITGAGNPFGSVIPPVASVPALGDLDGDGDLDLVSRNRYYENTGDGVTPLYVERTGSANPLNGLPPAASSLGDVDRDGDLDAALGLPDGRLFYLENTGTADAPTFAIRTGPLNGHDVGLEALPTLVDLDADADLDLVSGESGGALFTFYMPEPAPSGLLAAGTSLLAWLARRRGRSS